MNDTMSDTMNDAMNDAMNDQKTSSEKRFRFMRYLSRYPSTFFKAALEAAGIGRATPLPPMPQGLHRGLKRCSRRSLPLAAIGSLARVFLLFAGLAAPVFANADETRALLTGTALDKDNQALDFEIVAKSRKDPIGGHIHLAQSTYEIVRISRHGLIGARRFIDGGSAADRDAEFAVFSSSFNDQTATGDPWVAAREVYGCDKPYNAFIALYLIEGEAAVKAIGAIPFARLTDDSSLAAQSKVLCFMALPP